ncbi:hypothetical protein [Alkalicoccus urumqiensis]|uniref:Uncharacterized protein n=1 Tax=Alkalicoccus urumqiensis TaxID=1548213 RepID=A0A2P6MGR4_ALKUR|nr:hypothetical protein [Alkalicoccus urumqiensis]PRO65463.1 hypothetical protein C6I21_09920 [Alkalicoccus urumqiensis]
MEKKYSLIVLDDNGETQQIPDPVNGTDMEEVFMENKDFACSFYDKLKEMYDGFSVKMLYK